MTITELHEIIGGNLTDMFDYSINKSKDYKTIILSMEAMTAERVRTIIQNDFIAEVRDCYFPSENKTIIQVYVRQREIKDIEFIH